MTTDGGYEMAEWLSGGEVTRAAARIAISAVPVAGGPAIELFNWLFAEPLTRRRDEWLERLASDLVRVEEKFDVRLELLGRDSRFLSLVSKLRGRHLELTRRTSAVRSATSC